MNPNTVSADSDFKGGRGTWRSTYHYAVFLNGSAVVWKARRHSCCGIVDDRSQVHSDQSGRSGGGLDTVVNLLSELNHNVRKPVSFFNDIQGGTKFCFNPEFHSRMKHLPLESHYIRQEVEASRISVT